MQLFKFIRQYLNGQRNKNLRNEVLLHLTFDKLFQFHSLQHCNLRLPIVNAKHPPHIYIVAVALEMMCIDLTFIDLDDTVKL